MCRLGLGHCGLMSGIVSRLLDTNMISGHQYCPGTSECYGHKGTSSCCSDTTIVKSSTHTPSPHTIAASGNRSNINRKNVQTKNIYCRNCVQKATPQSPMSVRPSVRLSSKPLNSLKSSSFIIHLSSFIILHSSFIHPSSFFIHPSFISRLLSFSACLLKQNSRHMIESTSETKSLF